MNTKETKHHIEVYRDENGKLDEAGIADLLTWAYDKGWVEGREDLMEEQNFFETKGA